MFSFKWTNENFKEIEDLACKRGWLQAVQLVIVVANIFIVERFSNIIFIHYIQYILSKVDHFQLDNPNIFLLSSPGVEQEGGSGLICQYCRISKLV